MPPLQVRRVLRWTDAEADSVADAAAQLRLDCPEPPLVEILRRAQEQCLPADRRRALVSMKDAPNLPEKVRIRLGALEAQAERGRAPAPPPPLPPTPEQILAAMTDEALLTYVQSRVPSGRLIALALGAVAETVARIDRTERAAAETLRRVEGWSVEIADHLTAPKVNGHANGEAKGSPAPRWKPRIAVIGGTGNQLAPIQQSCAAVAELTFYPEGNRVNGSRVPRGADWAVRWARFAGHESQTAAHQAVGREKVVNVFGGSGEVIRTIHELAARSVKGAKP